VEAIVLELPSLSILPFSGTVLFDPAGSLLPGRDLFEVKINQLFTKKGILMEEGKRKKIEAKLRQMIALHNKSQEKKRRVSSTPRGTRVIRRRKDSPDKHIM
jgi:hypothetical protein